MNTIQTRQRERFFSFSFTLIEILITIAIISILAGMLMVALQKVREKGRQIVCMNNLNQIGKAIYMYANDSDGYLVPDLLGYPVPYWTELLRPYFGLETVLLSYPTGHTESIYIPVSGVFKCPSGQVDIPANREGMIYFYYDYCQLYGLNLDLRNKEIKIEQVPRPSEKILLGEIQHSGDVITHYNYYSDGIAGMYECPYNDEPEPTTERGQHFNAYRHNDGANFLFVDGHVEWWPRLGKDWKDPDIDGAYNKHWELTAP